MQLVIEINMQTSCYDGEKNLFNKFLQLLEDIENHKYSRVINITKTSRRHCQAYVSLEKSFYNVLVSSKILTKNNHVTTK